MTDTGGDIITPSFFVSILYLIYITKCTDLYLIFKLYEAKGDDVMRKTILLLSLILLIVSCAHTPTHEQLNNADYGPCPTNYENTIKDYFYKDVYGPANVVYTFDSPMKTWVPGNHWWNSEKYGWGVCGNINIESSYTNYKSSKRFFVLMRYDTVISGTLKGSYLCNKMKEESIK